VAKKTRRGQKQCPACKTWIKGTRAKFCPECNYDFVTKQAAPVAEAAAAEKSARAGDAITLEQLRKLAGAVRTAGGFSRLDELLGLIREVGGMKRFKDLLEAMSLTEGADIPY
jgi:hypothetical protein